MAEKKITILVAPLDWGLGHTTRCLPIIQEFMQLECNILVACNSKQKEMLVAEFPGISTIDLEGYDLKYGKNRLATIFYIIIQIPKILTKIKRENRWINHFLRNNPVDLIISDNRFGLYSRQAPCVFVTHQLYIKTGLGKWADLVVQQFNYRFINRFTSCWIPDFPGTKNLAGLLSHPRTKPAVPVEYIGALSRFTGCSTQADRIPLLIVLSGPEPQRSLFESILLKQLEQVVIRTVIVRGVPESEQIPRTPHHVVIVNYSNGPKLNQLLCMADLVCCRSGYTSIMDLMKLQKKSILVPTPGQAEQEYLGSLMQDQHFALVMNQEHFKLPEALEKSASFPYISIPIEMTHYRESIERILKEIRK